MVKKVLCGYCNKPIHIEEFGGVEGGVFYHKKCLILKELGEYK